METPVDAVEHRKKRSPWVRRLTILVILGLGALFILGRIRPKNLGVNDGQLAACPASPNCVSTQSERDDQQVTPLQMSGTTEEVMRAAQDIIDQMPRTRLVSQGADYLHAECTSLILRFVDDLEIWADSASQTIHARSASRVGYSDMGVNRERVELVFTKLKAAGVAQ